MSISVDTVNLRFNVKPDYDQQQLQQLQEDLKNGQKELEKTRRAMDKLAKNGLNAMTKEEREEFDRLSKTLTKTAREVHENEQKMKSFTRTADINKMSIQQLGQRAKDLTAVLNNLNPNSEDFKGYKAELDAVKERMKELKTVAKETGESLTKWGRFIEGTNQILWFTEFVGKAADKIVAWADQYVQSFAKMDEAMTDVMKYTGQTKREVEEMNETFSRMTTRTPREELNALAGAAGRLGITARRDIEGFVDAADKINVALGDDLGEGAIDQIGKLTMVFGADKTKGLNGAMLATGSAINVLGANSSANTGFITEFTSAMAGMAVNARISQTDIMGYASALSQAGVEGQTASGVFAQMITKMFTDPAKFARAARLDVKQFTDLLKTDANAAILQFLNGLKQNGGFDSLAPALKSLKMQGTQAVPVISSLINKMDELKKAQTDARQAYDEGTSIIDEFNNANSSAAAKLDMAKKAMNDAAADLGKKLMPIIENSISVGTIGVKTISSLISFTIQYRAQLIALAATVATLTAMWKAHTVLQAIVDGWNKAIALGNKAVAASMVLLRSAGVALHAVWALMTKGVQGYVAVMRAAKLASLTNPWTALATALTVVGVAIYGMIKAWNAHSKALREQDPAWRAAKAHAKDMQDISKRVSSETAKEISTINRLTSIIRSNAFSVDERRAAIQRLESIVPGYHANIDKEGKLIETNTKKLDEYIGNLKRAARAQAYADKLAEIEQKKLENDIKLRKKQNNLKLVDAELNRGKDTIYKSEKQHIYRPSSTPGISGAEYDIETNDRLVKKQEERKKQQDAVNDAIKEQNTLLREEQLLERQMQKDGIVKEFIVNGTTSPTSPASSVSGGSPAETSTETDKERSARQKKQREAEAQAKQAYEREKLLLRQQYQDKKLLQDEWHDKEFQAEQRYIASIADIRKKHGASEAERMEVQNMQLDSITKEANYQREREKQRTAERLADLDRQQGADEIALARQRLDGEVATQQEYDERKLQLEIDYQRRRIVFLRQGSAEYQQAMKQLLQLEQQQADSASRFTREGKQRYQAGMNTFLHDQFQDAGSFERMRQLNEEFYEQDRISYQQYQQNLTEIARQETEQRQQIQQTAIDATQQLLSSASSFFSAMQQRETAEVDAKYKRLIAAAKKQGKDTTKLEEQQEQEKAAIQKKYADRNFQIQVLQIIANTALGISKTIAQLGMPWAIPFVAMTAAAGALQLASAKAAADQAAGLYDGGFSEGYTTKGNPREQAGVIPVHKNEFVANHRAVANPNVRPVLDVIDRHQRVGDIQMLNATRLLEEAYGQGRYRGGYTSPSSSSVGYTAAAPQSEAADLLPILTRIAENTAQSLTVRDLRREIRHEERLENNAHR